MRLLLLLLPLFLSIRTAPSMVSGQQTLPADQEEVLRFHERMWEAAQKRDFDTWSRYVADDCIFSDDEGQTTTKAEIMQHLRRMPRAYDRSENHREFLLRVHGDTAVLNFRLTVHERFTDSDIITEMRHTETFARSGGSWLLVAEQWGALPVNFRKPVRTDNARFKDYVGRYEWRPDGPVDEVSLHDGKLLSRLTGDAEDHEYRPLGSETFFLNDDLGTVRFVRDSKNRVVGYTYRRTDGQEIHVKKIR